MAEKKPSKYSDRSTIGSAEELDAYGVWVKSEPQDLTAGLTEAVNFDAEAVPYEADFDTGFGDTEESDYGFAGLDQEIPEADVAESHHVNFDDGITGQKEQGAEEESTRLLMRIADELSSIRVELSTLKKEFAGVHIEGGPGVKAEARRGGFFDGEEGDDEKITLTGDEMENILTSAGFSEGEDLDFDAQRQADEAALRELSEQNESAAGADEEIEIDFDNLGIKLDDDTEAEAQDEFPPLEAGTDDDFETSSFDALSLDDMPAPEEIPSEDMPALEEQEDAQAFAEELMPLVPPEEDDEELRDLRLDGAIPLTPTPEDSDYLESDPFTLDDSGLEETAPEDVSFAENVSSENTVLEEPVFEDIISGENTEDLDFGDASFDLNVDDFSAESPALSEEAASADSLPALEEETSIEQTFDADSLDISADNLPALEEETGVEQTFDTGSLDLSEAVIDEPDLSAGLVDPPLEEPVLGDISFGDDISLDMDDFESSLDLDIKDDSADSPVDNVADASLESLAIDDTIDTSAGLGAADDLSLADDLVMDDAETNVELDTGASGPADDLADDLTGSLADDLVMDDVEANVELDTGDSGLAGDLDGGLADDLTGSLADDLVMDDVETNVELDTGDSGPASGVADGLAGDLDGGVADDLTDSLADDLVMDDVETNVELDTGDSGPASGLADEPVGDFDGGLTDDLDGSIADDLTGSLADDLVMDDVETNVELDTGDSGPASGLVGGLADDEPDDEPVGDLAGDNFDDGLTGVIPEGLEVNAEEAPVSVDDDLEAFADDLSIDGGEINLPETSAAAADADVSGDVDIPSGFKNELKSVLSYMDHLLESLPEDKIEEFAKSEYFDSYKKIFKELGLV